MVSSGFFCGVRFQTLRPFHFHFQFACSPCLRQGSVRARWPPPAVQKHAHQTFLFVSEWLCDETGDSSGECDSAWDWLYEPSDETCCHRCQLGYVAAPHNNILVKPTGVRPILRITMRRVSGGRGWCGVPSSWLPCGRWTSDWW